jgi:phage baseplate assembly protein W
VREVTQALTLWEPRITLVSMTAQPVIDNTVQSGAHLDVSVTWQLKLTANGVSAGTAGTNQTTFVSIFTP